MGMRDKRLRIIPPRPIVIDSAIMPDVASAGDAPADCSPCITITKELENPTMPAKPPARMAWAEIEYVFAIGISNTGIN
jgi:hypothetical protein